MCVWCDLRPPFDDGGPIVAPEDGEDAWDIEFGDE